MAGAIRIGTSGWSYDDWVGCFYPAGTKPGDYLAHYCRHFDIVEVDSTYYRPPSARMVSGWAERGRERTLLAQWIAGREGDGEGGHKQTQASYS